MFRNSKNPLIISLIVSFFLIFSLNFISPGNLSLFPNPGINEAGNKILYTFNFSSTNDCNPSNIILNYTKIVQIDTRGVGFVSIDISNLTQIPLALCEFKEGTYILRKNHSFSDIVFNQIYARNLNLSGDAIIKGSVNVTGNVTAKYFLGNGSQLTDTFVNTNIVYYNESGNFTANQNITGNITSNYGFFDYLGSLLDRITKLWVTDINASGEIKVGGNVTASWFIGNLNASYIQNNNWLEDSQESSLNVNRSGFWDNLNSPADLLYSTFGAGFWDTNVDLGDNNLTVNGTTLFVDTQGRVGIGTITPQDTLNVIGNINATGNIYSNNYQVTSYQRTVDTKNVTMTAVI